MDEDGDFASGADGCSRIMNVAGSFVTSSAAC